MASNLHDIPGNHVATAQIPAHAAATATELVTIWRAPFAAKIVSVEVIPDAAASGADTNTTHYNLINAGTDGNDTTELDNADFVSGTDMVAGTAIAVYEPAAPLAVVAGTILQLQIEKVGTGLALPRCTAVITYQGN